MFFALCQCARKLWLDLDDLGLGEPADKIDVVHGKIDHHAYIRHAGRKRTHAGDGNRQYVLLPGSPL